MPKQVGISNPFILLLVIAVTTVTAALLLINQSEVLANPASDIPILPGQANIQLVPVQLAPGIIGFALIDASNYTFCIYEFNPRRAEHERLALIAVRNFRFDSQLEDYNNAEPRPSQVRQWVEHAQEIKNSGSQDQPGEIEKPMDPQK
jgi:hypothetical protein